ncbi:MAG: hypothetical protein ACHQ49_08405 [Elusimicrobiota bacterium]
MKRPPRAPFDWPAFGRTLPFQPALVWIAAALLLRPAANATPALLGASCGGPERAGLKNCAFIVYALLLPPAAAALVYLLTGRRRMSRPHRIIGDGCLALVLLVSSGNAVALVRSVRANWTTALYGLSSLRSACWK